MSFLFRPVEIEMDHEAYAKFLIRHHDELGLPYAFPHKLSFLGSPLLYGKGLLIIDEESYELAGAAGFVYGTGADEFGDRSLCQIEIAFLRKDVRGTTLFLRGMRALLELMRSEAGDAEARVVQFWLTAEQSRSRLYADKLLALPGAEATPADGLTRCVIPFRALDRYCARFE